MYSEAPFQNPYVNSIAESLSAPARIRANALRQTGAIQANAQQQRGQIAGQTAQQIGQTIAAIPGQIAQGQQQAQAQQVRALQVKQLTDEAAAAEQQKQIDTQINGLMRGSLVTDPDTGLMTYDRPKLQQGFADLGIADQWPTYAERLDKSDAAIGRVRAEQKEALKDIAGLVDAAGNQAVVFANEVERAIENGLITERQAAPYLDAVKRDPNAIAAITASILGKAPTKLEQRDPTKDLIDPVTGKVVTPGTPAAPEPPKPANSQEAEFRLDGKDVKGDYVPGVGGQPGKYFYKGVDVTGQATKIPPASTTARPEGLTPNAALDATLKLRDRFVRETQAAQLVKTQYEQMKSSLDAVKKGSAAAGSQGVLVTFQKILDPTSVVRESEYARSSSGLSLLNRLEGQWMKIQQGGAGVSVGELETFVKLAEQWVKNSATAAKQTQEQIDNIATEYGLKPENITRDMGASVVPQPAANAPKLGQIVTVKGQKVRVTAIKPDGTYQGVPVK